ncbi:hypothetical protein L249_8571 [Ophiocordyceps polyrhachis-furcata BCC 54312]|uniref:Uncharacterized protein n=1 Tax=Ophiocordyceps polyrhachis-furcata BCC 54312 TaxID=1330021 RepID=A0A367L776_9HYPO|nr:hypothetical protein L249_8571 [Ophiocordyceps polyrhachis-furcata BCC 54312]
MEGTPMPLAGIVAAAINMPCRSSTNSENNIRVPGRRPGRNEQQVEVKVAWEPMIFGQHAVEHSMSPLSSARLSSLLLLFCPLPDSSQVQNAAMTANSNSNSNHNSNNNNNNKKKKRRRRRRRKGEKKREAAYREGGGGGGGGRHGTE